MNSERADAELASSLQQSEEAPSVEQTSSENHSPATDISRDIGLPLLRMDHDLSSSAEQQQPNVFVLSWPFRAMRQMHASMMLRALMQGMEEADFEGEILQSVLAQSAEDVLQTVIERSIVEQERQRNVPPARDGAQEALPRAIVIKEDLMDETTSQCAICLEKYTLGASATRMLCSHLFCSSCICSWLSTANSCPVCRYELPTDNAAFEEGRTERMNGRMACLKEGELRMMSSCGLKRLMTLLNIPIARFTSKADLLKKLRDDAHVQLSVDRADICYTDDDLANLDVIAMQALMERHLPSRGFRKDSRAEDVMRQELRRSFTASGLLAPSSPPSSGTSPPSSSASPPSSGKMGVFRRQSTTKQEVLGKLKRIQAAVNTSMFRTSSSASADRGTTSDVSTAEVGKCFDLSTAPAEMGPCSSSDAESRLWPARADPVDDVELEGDVVTTSTSERSGGRLSFFRRSLRSTQRTPLPRSSIMQKE
jgi:hypothetical protein